MTVEVREPPPSKEVTVLEERIERLRARRDALVEEHEEAEKKANRASGHSMHLYKELKRAEDELSRLAMALTIIRKVDEDSRKPLGLGT